MSKSKQYLTDTILESPIAVLVVAVLAMVLGVVFLSSNSSNRPIPEEEAVAYSGYFEYYDDSWENYRRIQFEDGSIFDVDAHTETAEFYETMKTLPRGTVLHILVNPNNDYVAQIQTDTEELLNFQDSQEAIYQYGWGYVGIGVFTCFCSVFLGAYSLLAMNHRRKEKARRASRKKDARHCADASAKSRILLEADVQCYHICYRRVKSTNELVVNGWVYDEITEVIEFAHNLSATVDGHTIEAGYDVRQSLSYIRFDGKTVKKKKRWF